MDFELLPRSYYISTSFSNNEHIYMDHFGWEKCRPGHHFYCYRNIFLIHYIQKGGGTLKINNQEYPLKAGDAFLIRPNQPAIYYPDQADPWEYYYFAFNGTLANDFVKNTVFQNNIPVYSLRNDSLAEMIVHFMEEIEQVTSPQFYTLEQLFRFLQFFAKSIEESNGQSDDDADKKGSIASYYTEQVRSYIYSNFREHITVSNMAARLNINRSLLYSYFKKETGTDIMSFLISIRMQHAREYLSHTDLPVNSIATIVGYSNYTSFQRAFTQKNGMTPGEYRKAEQLKSSNTKYFSIFSDDSGPAIQTIKKS